MPKRTGTAFRWSKKEQERRSGAFRLETNPARKRTSLCSAGAYADDVALPAFAVQQSIDISCLRRAHSSKRTAAALLNADVLGRTDGRTDGRTPYRYIDSAPRTMRAVQINVDIAWTQLNSTQLIWPDMNWTGNLSSRVPWIVVIFAFRSNWTL